MAVLETFEILFSSNAKELEEGAEQAENAVDDVEQSLVKTDNAAEKLGDSFTDLIGAFSGAIAGIVGAGALLASTIEQAAETDALGKFSDSLGLNIEEVGAWSEAAGRAGGSAEEFQGSIKALQSNLQEMAIGGGADAAEAFSRLGISATDSSGNIKGVFDLLPEIAGSFESLSNAQQIELGEKLGLDQGTIQLLQAGKLSIEELVKRQHKLGVATEEDAKLAAQFNDAIADSGQIFNDITRSIGIFLLPALTDILKGFETVTNFVKENQDFVKAFFVAVAGIITYIYLPAILSAAAATLTAAAPFIAIAAVIAAVSAAFALLYDDIINFMAGNDSVIGRIAQKWPVVGNVVRAIIEDFKAFFSELKAIYEFISGVFSKALDGIGGALGKVGSFLGLDKSVQSATQSANNVIGELQSNPLANESSLAASLVSNAQTVNRNTTVSVGRVNVDARGGNSEQISSGVGAALKEQMQQTVSNYDDGVLI